MLKGTLLATALAVAGPALGQSGTTYQQPYTPPQQQPPPAQQPPSQQQPPAQGGTTAAPGGASQQVVVTPPSGQPGTTTAPPPSSTTVVTPPPAAGTETQVIVERRERPNPMATVATDAAYGGVAGLLVGTGVSLINEWDDWQRDMMIGAGAGLLVGAAVGVIHATYEAREADRRERRVAFRDGLGTTDRDPVVSAPTYVGWAGRF
ncbi:hypothetical protein [Anaeromyxobacter sp. Fw109-5]|uniref:hypothetical protein n=1 Tax=Anaeromyxobacter sp. (strain Fw109-5) TaxID=404589 RepID=UPI0000ED7E6E|nr:hypothetical protein [Anaeromyxobacter sp. Fw109-5]ABS25049.1 conserved hypothetical protein [Anaeromyxobacter sp. Fw109-5]